MLVHLGIQLRTICSLKIARYTLNSHLMAECIPPSYWVSHNLYSSFPSCHRKPSTRQLMIRQDTKEKNEKYFYPQPKSTKSKLQRKGRILLNELKETKRRMRKRMESIIERENIWTIPNILCATRILISPYLGYLIMKMDFNSAFCLMVFAGITDLLDGLIARNFESQSSKLGSFLDPMADKILVATMFLTLTYVDLMPGTLTILIVTRDISLATAGFYIRYKSLPPPRTIGRYFDVTHATAQLVPTFISKVNTLVQLCTVGATLGAPVVQFISHSTLCTLWWITGVTTVLSGFSYIFSKNTYKLLKENKIKY